MQRRVTPEPAELPRAAGIGIELLRWSAKRNRLTAEAAKQLLQRARPSLEWLRERRIDSLLFLAARHNAPAQRLYDKVWRAQRVALLQTLRHLISEGVHIMVCKGAELNARFYGERGLHAACDVDLLVPTAQLGTAHRVLYATGYGQGLIDVAQARIADVSPLEVSRLEARHYELFPFRRLLPLDLDADERQFIDRLRATQRAQMRKDQAHRRRWPRVPPPYRNPPPPVWLTDDGRYLLTMEIDLHHGVSIEFKSDSFFKRAIPSALGCGWTLGLADHLWFLTNRLYHEVGLGTTNSLRTFALLAPLVQCPNIDWDIVLGAATELDIRPGLFYYLTFLDRLVGGAVPPTVLAQLSVRHGGERRDWGWQLGRLFGRANADPIGLPLS